VTELLIALPSVSAEGGFSGLILKIALSKQAPLDIVIAPFTVETLQEKISYSTTK
jgi:hypothetical protein